MSVCMHFYAFGFEKEWRRKRIASDCKDLFKIYRHNQRNIDVVINRNGMKTQLKFQQYQDKEALPMRLKYY